MSDETKQAHAMSQSEAVQHVSDAAWEALIQDRPVIGRVTGLRDEYAKYFASLGAVLRTVSEWRKLDDAERELDATLKRVANSVYEDYAVLCERDDLRSQLAAKTAECERLTKRAATFEAVVMDMHKAIGVEFGDNVYLAIERLREGREDGQNHGDVSERNRECGSMGGGVRPVAYSGIATLADTLDPRLGIQQPEGEPGEPMPYWRRRMHD